MTSGGYEALGLSLSLWLWFLLKHGHPRGRGVPGLLLQGLIGGLLAAFPASWLNDAVIGALGVSSLWALNDPGQAALLSLFVGANEELMKFLATGLWVARLRRFREPIDGVLYATTVALFFATYENLLYMASFGPGVLLPRSVTAVPLHLGLAVIWGSALTERAYFRTPVLRTYGPPLLLAALLHAGFNYVQFVVTAPLAALGVALLCALLIFRFMRRRLDALRRESPFVRAGTCTACSAVNPVVANFCGRCGTPLLRRFYQACKRCGTRTEIAARFCPACGARLTRHLPMFNDPSSPPGPDPGAGPASAQDASRPGV